MNFKKWKFGLIVACVTGLATAFAVGVIVPAMTLKEGCFVLAGSIAKDILLFLAQNPADKVSFESERTISDNKTGQTTTETRKVEITQDQTKNEKTP